MDALTDRLRGNYKIGRNGEFGTRDFSDFIPPIAIEAANKIEELERIISESSMSETSHRYKEIRKVLGNIADWELPEATLSTGEKCHYEAAYGSNGARDYFRKLAIDALSS